MSDLTVPGLSDDEQADLAELWRQLTATRAGNELRTTYYEGRRAIRQLGTLVPPQYYTLGIVLGWSAKAVDMLARRCNLDTFVWADGALRDLGMQEVWEDNHLASEFSQGMTSSLIHGPAFLITTTGSDGEPDVLIHTKNALSATGMWSQRTRSLRSALSVLDWDDRGEPTEFVLYLHNLTVTCLKDQGKWEVDRHIHQYGVPVEPLIYKPLPGRPYGYSRISKPVMSLQDRATRTAIRMEGNADVYSFPEFWMLGADESVFKNADGTVKDVWSIRLGRIKGIPDDDEAANPRADVKQFPASSPAPHIEQFKQQAMSFSGETSIPLTSLGVSDMSNPTSADSYIASREDLIAEAEGATDEWAPAFKRTMLRALQMKNGLPEIPPEWRTVRPKFRSPIYTSRAAAADAGAKQLGAAPWLAETEVGLELLGLEPGQIERALAERRRANAAGMLDKLVAVTGAPTDGVG